MNEIISFLQEQNPDFDQGFALFCKYSRNQSLMRYIGRKRDLQKLMYELDKLKGVTKVNPNCQTQLVQFSRASFKAPEQPVPPTEQPVQINRTIDDRKTRRSDLPEDLKSEYDLNVEDYKKMRSLHEKMKVANSDIGRAEFRSQIIELDKIIKSRWAKIDAYLSSSPTEIKINVNTNRAYISKMLNKEDLTAEQIATVKKRVQELRQVQASISEATLKKLKEKGLE